ncbi:MAG: hypothetical protein R2854_11560 [Caldilineaceae bacterium]
MSSIILQAATDMRIEDADKENIVRNLFLDHAQLVIDLEVAVQEYNTA